MIYALLPAKIGGFPESPGNIIGDNMSTKTRLSTSQLPDVKIMNLNDAWQQLHLLVEDLPIQTPGRSLHQHLETVFDDGERGEHHHHCENQRADRVGIFKLGLDPDYHTRDYHTH